MSAWPATVSTRTPEGWVLRATPGLDRGRSNHALTPCRELSMSELPAAIAAVEAFARRHGIATGIQASPLAMHGGLMRELDTRGWGTRWPVLVMTARRDDRVWSETVPVEAADQATPQWLDAWQRCEERPRDDVDAHATTVLRLLAGRATFARVEERAVGIAVEGAGLVGLFCLAVAAESRRTGLGTALVRTLLAGSSAAVAYLQVEEVNAPGIGLYSRLGFTEAYRYCHRVAPSSGEGRFVGRAAE